MTAPGASQDLVGPFGAFFVFGTTAPLRARFASAITGGERGRARRDRDAPARRVICMVPAMATQRKRKVPVPHALPPRPILRATAAAITDGYRRSQRDLPWRRARDPYAIWVSEIMLQQTRVATVIPYWQRWMARFPSVAALAEAPLDDVLGAWAGLGFYGRARNLHRGAREVVARWGGELPQRCAELREVPGIGPYTAGAIASIAHGERAALVDGNVARVFARVFAIAQDIKASATQPTLWRLADALMAELPEEFAAGELNQGLMELGATICGVGEPRCLVCPLAPKGLCQAHARGIQGTLPIARAPKPAAQLPMISLVAIWAMRGDKVVLARRKPRGLFGGLWELPSGTSAEAAAAVIGAQLSDGPAVAFHEQVLSHRRLSIRVQVAAPPKALGQPADPSYDELQYFRVGDTAELAIAAATAALFTAYQDHPWSSAGSAASATAPKTQASSTPRRGRPKGSTRSSPIKRK
jgi:A/G-specific adenine glycosylase